jgi:hypothetical protein
MRSVAWVNGINRLSGPELFALDHAANRIGTTTTNLATCEGFESGGTFNPAEPNRAGSGAIGVIQFMPKVMCVLLGMPFNDDTANVAAARFCKMTFIEQQEYVVKYFGWFRSKNLSALEDLYCAIFWPAAIAKPDDYVIGPRDSAVYRQNAGFDKGGNRDGLIQKWEVCAAIRRYRDTADGKPDIAIPQPTDGDAPLFSSDDLDAVRALQEKTTTMAMDDYWQNASPFPDEETPSDEAPPTPRNT